jgi:hypothetical protein
VQCVVKRALQVLRKRLHFKAYNVSIVQHLTDVDMVVRMEFCMQMFPDMSRWREGQEMILKEFTCHSALQDSGNGLPRQNKKP